MATQTSFYGDNTEYSSITTGEELLEDLQEIEEAVAEDAAAAAASAAAAAASAAELLDYANSLFDPQGVYSDVTEYEYGQVVEDQDATWYYHNDAASTGNQPPTLPTKADDYWQWIAGEGPAGADGDTTDTLLDAAILYQRADEHNWPIVPSKSFIAKPEGDLPTGMTFTRSTVQYERGPDLVWRSNAIDTLSHAYDKDGRYLGWAIFATATNEIENNTGTGVVAGSPGTAPTNAGSVSTTFGGTTRTIGAATTEDGIDAWDITYAASPTTSAASGTIGHATSMQIAAATGDNFVLSSFIKLQAGTDTGMTFTLRLSERDAAGAALTAHDLVIEPTNARLGSQRFVLTAETTHVDCAYVIPQIIMTCLDATAVNFTLRIGWTQLESGLRETPPIPTASAVGVRGSDVLTCTSLGDWFNATEFMVRVRAYVTRMRAAEEPLIQLDDNTADERFRVYINGSNAIASLVTVGGVDVHDGSTSDSLLASAGNRDFIAVARYKADDFAQARDGGRSQNQGDSGAMATVDRIRFGRTTSSSNVFRGYMKEVDFFPLSSSGPSDNIEVVLSTPDTNKGRQLRAVHLGDSIWDTYQVSEAVAARTGIRSINGAFAGTRLSDNGAATNPLCGWALATSIATGSWTAAIAAADAEVGSRPYWPEKIRRLAAIDWTKIDILTFAHGTNDWSGEAVLGDTGSAQDETNFYGCVHYIIDQILTAYPHIQLIFITPMLRTTGSNGNGDTMLDFVDAMIEVCEDQIVPVFDSYRKLGINNYNAGTFLSDGLHPSNLGVRLIAQKVSAFITAGA
jgi:lysophospholipase L1-like esterase